MSVNHAPDRRRRALAGAGLVMALSWALAPAPGATAARASSSADPAVTEGRFAAAGTRAEYLRGERGAEAPAPAKSARYAARHPSRPARRQRQLVVTIAA